MKKTALQAMLYDFDKVKTMSDLQKYKALFNDTGVEYGIVYDEKSKCITLVLDSACGSKNLVGVLVEFCFDEQEKFLSVGVWK